MKIPANPLTYRYHWLRRPLSHTTILVLFFGAPALGLFGMDVEHLTITWLNHSYALNWQTMFWVPIVFFALVLLIALSSFMFGRLFCGWLCPHNALTECLTQLRKTVLTLPRNFKSPLQVSTWVGAISLMSILAVVLTCLLASYFIPPQALVQQIITGTIHPALSWGIGLFSIISAFLFLAGHHFCRYACPYGMAQSVSAYQEGRPGHPMQIQYLGSSDDCGHCKACQSSCPVDIDPRVQPAKVGEMMGCFNCGECIDACKTVFHKQVEKTSLLRFQQLWQH